MAHQPVPRLPSSVGIVCVLATTALFFVLGVPNTLLAAGLGAVFACSKQGEASSSSSLSSPARLRLARLQELRLSPDLVDQQGYAAAQEGEAAAAWWGALASSEADALAIARSERGPWGVAASGSSSSTTRAQ